jgi:hypothetical protein
MLVYVLFKDTLSSVNVYLELKPTALLMTRGKSRKSIDTITGPGRNPSIVV